MLFVVLRFSSRETAFSEIFRKILLNIHYNCSVLEVLNGLTVKNSVLNTVKKAQKK